MNHLRSIGSMLFLAVALVAIGAVTRPTKEDVYVLAGGISVAILSSCVLLFLIARICDLRRVKSRS